MICEQTVVSASGLLLTEQEVDAAAAAVLRQGAFGKPTNRQTNRKVGSQAGMQVERPKKQEETTYGVEEKPWQKTKL